VDEKYEELLVEQDSFEAPEVYEAPALTFIEASTEAEAWDMCICFCAH